jgi:hypothetical protein
MNNNITIEVDNLSEAASIIEDDIKELEQLLLEELYGRIVDKTPVLSGKARDGWKLDAINSSITNDVEYIGYLETGTSTSAPVGMVATTLIETDNIINDILT